MASKGFATIFIYFLAARMLSPEIFGQFNFLLALVAFFMIFCDFGISTATAKYTAEYSVNSPEKLKHILFTSAFSVFVACSGITFILLILGRVFFKQYYTQLLYLLPYLFFLPLASTIDGYYRGLKSFKSISIVTLLAGGITLTSSFLLIKTLGLNGALLSLGILYFLIASGLFFLKRRSALILDKKILKELFRYSTLIGLALLAFYLYSTVDILILKQFGYTIEIGYYGIINKIFLMVFIPTAVLGQAIGPNITKYASLGEYATLKRKFLSCLPPVLLLGIALSFTLYFCIPLFLKMFLPAYYSKSFILILRILIVLLPFKIWGAFFINGFLVPEGSARITTKWTFIGGIFNVISDYILIWFLGFTGVFLSTLVIHSLVLTIQTVVFYRSLGRKTAMGTI